MIPRSALRPVVAFNVALLILYPVSWIAPLARAICAEPEIIFFDEPTTGLDPIMADVINDLIREIVVEMGVTALTITHDMTSVRKIADKVAMIHEGVIQWTGAVSEIDTTDNAFVHQFVNGLPEGPIEANTRARPPAARFDISTPTRFTSSSFARSTCPASAMAFARKVLVRMTSLPAST